MAIHRTVFYSPDRKLRITADPAGTVFTVESQDGTVLRRFAGLDALLVFLAGLGIQPSDLVED